MPFSTLGLSEPILRAIAESGYSKPTPIQSKTIPAVLAGKDLMAAAQTGTGKTAGFILPLLQRLSDGPKVKANHVRALVLTPTRELAEQVAQNTASYSKYLPLKSSVVYGGVKINPQMMKLRGGVDLLVATPGRLLDLASKNAIKFAQLETLVLDEADRMLDMGFSDEINKIIALLPNKRQTLLFSATFSDDIRKLSKRLLNNPLQIDISPRNSTAKSVKQWVYEVDKSKKPALLSHLIRNRNWSQVLVFTNTKKGADELVRKLKSDNLSAVAIHGDKSQGLRTRALKDFKTNKTRILVATDIAARGLDISELPHVINFDLPKVAEDYIHRIGRTGRAGLQGEGISLVSADEVKNLAAIESLIKQTLTREVETGFVPTHKVPLTRQTQARQKKPKKAKLKQRPAGGRSDSTKSKTTEEKPSRRGKRQEEDIQKGRNRPRRDRKTDQTDKGTTAKLRRGSTRKVTRARSPQK
ncbi:ATP-dependent RNA helicase RhlE [Malonomonas rubra DSM 5091]|uniref:DEAD-box ATP-dependent RNA helicase RhpA n=1 Tax=Malonomonas rubra DSM 5091 TaxID=1122189 RepID=A0A1M6LX62_MALRU|nr:DEAD/DEAH box helicase [Malonomonas rubra]SHJ75742.1 ATP-dependent RNA helicase RhlE [Malonomonas rubra DSM 5091]